ncbi:hypothetical protein OIU85_002444 [Salix viminalis]|uniref:Ubiquitin carboxyl-terminal hydrolase n=1 Tax=Salix viminalis TaxID=40686 RepID=A0A9Q0ZYV9_SALVM|nr:hypothetical protein OIU85_002444 [Salix viminalis]
MSWQPSLLSQKRKNGPPLGLKNLGNSCYLNSVLQCLTYTPPLANFCLRLQHSSLCDSLANGEGKRDCPFCILEKQIVRSLSLDLPLDAPAKIQSCLKIFAEHFRCGRQEDAHEFLRYVIDACHNTCLRLKKLSWKGIENGGDGSVVKKIFGGALQSQVKCLCCNCESNKVDEIMDISLDVLNSNSVRDAMQKFFQPEILDGNNKYKCENRDLRAYSVGRLISPIAFEEVLVLSSFMCKTSQDPQPKYNLFGTIVHSGCSLESGHYYAYIKDTIGRWYCCNDSYVTLSTLQEVLSEKAYILFFSRTNQRPGSTDSAFTSNGDIPVTSKIDRVPSSPPVKFGFVGNSGSKSALPSVNGKVDPKCQNKEMNGNVKETVPVEICYKDVSTVTISNGFEKHKHVDAVEGGTRHTFAAASENGHSQNGAVNTVKPHICDRNDTTIKDAQSLAKVEEFKEVLKQEASSILGSCGLSDKVYNFMRARKRSCIQEAGNKPSGTDIKKLLITDAKQTFIPQIPESLKEDLVKRLQLFSQEK